MQFSVGILEGQVNKLDQEFIQEYKEYMSTTFDADFWQKVPQLRTVPVGESISTQTEVMPYERAEELVCASDTFSVSNCICRQGMRIMGEGCDKPLDLILVALDRFEQALFQVRYPACSGKINHSAYHSPDYQYQENPQDDPRDRSREGGWFTLILFLGFLFWFHLILSRHY